MSSYFTNDYNLASLKKITPKTFEFDFFITPRFEAQFTNQTYEELTSLLMRQIAKGVRTFIDVGAHYGFFDVLVSTSNPDCEIFTFEPIKENFEILTKNLDHNNVNAHSFQKAISNSKEIRKFEVSEASDNSGFIANPNASKLQTISVETETLDGLLEKINNGPLMAKIDVEGGEIEVIQGMLRMINQLEDVRLFIEFNPKCLKVNGHEPAELLEILQSCGFQIYFIDDLGKRFIKYKKSIEWENLLKEHSYCNLYCNKQETALNLCFFSHSSQLAGAEQSLIELVKELISDDGALCTVILPKKGPAEKLLQDAGVSTIIAPLNWWCSLNDISDKLLIKKQYTRSFNWIHENLYLLNNLDPDVILTNTMVIPWGALVAILLKKPHLWIINEFGELDHGFKFFEPFERVINFIESSSDKIVTCSNAVRKGLFPEASFEKVHTIYKHITVPEDKIKYDVSKNSWFKFPDATHLIISGSIMESKGQEDAILAVIDLINNRHRKVELILIGYADSVYQEYLQNLINDENVNDFVRILPFQEHVFPVVDEADIVLICSRMEAFGRVTLEAMLMQKMIIATNTGGTTEMISDGETGLLYTPGNYTQLAKQIEKIIDNPELGKGMAQKAFHFAKKTFTKENFGRNYSEMIYELKNQGYLFKGDSVAFLLSQYQGLIEEKNQSIHLLQEDVVKRQQTILYLNTQLAEREQELLKYELSKSWRITRPLRKIMNLFRSVRNRKD